MTSLTTAGSTLLTELADGHLPGVADPGRPALGHNARITRASLDAMARTTTRTRRALASQASQLAGSRRKEQ